MSFRLIYYFITLVVFPIFLGFYILHLWNWDFTVPLAYGVPGADEIWQLVATKTLLDTGWILNNPYLGAPDVSTWYANSASQISITHQIFMGLLGLVFDNSVKVQQYYFMLNFSLITLATFALGRSLKISPLLSTCIGLIFAFTSFRINSLFFAYLSNYYAIPLALISVYWVMLKEIGANSKLLIACFISIFVAATDGYYSFFYLLLLGFSFIDLLFTRSQLKDKLAVLLLICVTLATSLAITYPIREHRLKYPHEANQELVKQPAEAEVYSPTLKLIIAPIINHRLVILEKASKAIVDSANFNRKFPYINGAPVVLGVFGSVLLILSWFVLIRITSTPNHDSQYFTIIKISALLSLFVLLCSIAGGLGSLIAFVFPTIRAYERFPLFLYLILYIGAGAYLTEKINQSVGSKRIVLIAIIPIITTFVILDETPYDVLGLTNAGGFKARTERFYAERSLISKIENIEPNNAMIYQYPYSQYLSNNKYYGWGQFGQLRAYLHSHNLRWSNGATKDSYVDVWHEKIATLPLERLVPLVRSVGFDGILVDRLVLNETEYDDIKRKLFAMTGKEPLENNSAQMAYWQFEPLAYKVFYDKKFDHIEKIEINRKISRSDVVIPEFINVDQLMIVLKLIKNYPVVIDNIKYPTVFDIFEQSKQGYGWSKIKDVNSIEKVSCDSSAPIKPLANKFDLTVKNNSTFDWQLDSGPYPIRIGAIVMNADGKVIADLRMPSKEIVKSGGELHYKYTINDLIKQINGKIPNKMVITIKMVQDGNAWFTGRDSDSCTLKLNAE